MEKGIHFFLGANSGGGFSSLYDQLLDHRFSDLVIIKGGPGCGKSTLMRYVADAAQKQGQTVHFIHCSGDPDSLDGIILPQVNAAFVDGTSPHVLEPRYTAVHERYLDLSPCYDLAGVKGERGEIVRQSDAYRAAYASAYRVLRALSALEEERQNCLTAALDRSRLLRRAEGIATRELGSKKRGGGGAASVFFDGVSCKGEIAYITDNISDYEKVYVLDDAASLAHPMLELLKERAVAAGEKVLLGRHPLHPQKLRHLLIPSRSLAFVTGESGGEAYRRVRLTAMAETALSREEKARLRLLRRVQKSLAEEAVQELKAAKAAHDALEQSYHPYVDFAAVAALAQREAERILGA